MKDSYLPIRPFLVTLIVLMLTSVGVRAQNTGEDFVSNLHKFRVSSYVALDAYYRFSASNDSGTLNEIVSGINAANDAMNVVAGNTENILSPQQVESLNKEFDKFKSLMRDNINDVRKNGYPDLRLVSDMANQAQAMSDMAADLYQVALESNQTNPRVDAARSAAVMMAEMMARYSVRTNSSTAQTFQGAPTDSALDEQARQFDALLAQTIKGGADGELKSNLDDVSAKWQFIRSSYINFNERNVGFVIDRYSKGILAGLDNVIGILLSQS